MPITIPIDYRAFYKENPAALFECKATDEWPVAKANNAFFEALDCTEDHFVSVLGNFFARAIKESQLSEFNKDFKNYLKAYKKNHQTPAFCSTLTLKRHDHTYITVRFMAKFIEDSHERVACSFMPLSEELAVSEEETQAVVPDKIQEELAKKKTARDSLAAGLKDKTLLVAEDHPLTLQMLAKSLTSGGMNVDIAQNGARVVEMFETAPDGSYFAVLVDLDMPVLGGRDAAEKIRDIEKSRKTKNPVPIIAMASPKEASFDGDGIPDCFADVFIKPLRAQTVFEKLSAML